MPTGTLDLETVSVVVQDIPLGSVVVWSLRVLDVAPGRNLSDSLRRCEDRLYAEVTELLGIRRPPDETRRGWLRTRALYMILLAWTFPPKRKKHRAIDAAHSLLVSLSASTGLLFTASHIENETVLKTSRGFDPKLQAHLLGEDFDPASVRAYFAELKTWLRRPLGETDLQRGLQYCLLTSSDFYWGFAGELRERTVGIIGRFLEHISAILAQKRGKRGAADKRPEFKYTVLQKYPLETISYIPQLLGSATLSMAREQLAIRMCPSRLNKRERRPRHLPKVASRPLHKWQRRRAQLETVCRRALRLNFAHVVVRPVGNAPHEESAWASLSFQDYYTILVSSRYNVNGELGPVSIYEPGNEKLLVLWMAAHARRRLELDARTTSKALWLRVATLHRALPKDGLRRSVSFRLRSILQRFNVKQGTVVMRVENHELIPSSTIRKIVASTLVPTEAEATVSYALDHLQICRLKAPTILQRGRQHRVFSKEFCLERDFLPISASDRAAYACGRSLQFYAENWDVPLPDQPRRVLGAILNGGKRILEMVGAQYLTRAFEAQVFSTLKPLADLPQPWQDSHVLRVW